MEVFSIKLIAKTKIKEALFRAFNISLELEEIEITKPKKREYGHLSSNIALALSKKLKGDPRELAERIVEEIDKKDFIEKIQVMGPGFINFFFVKEAYFSQILSQIGYGCIKDRINNEKIKPGFIENHKLKDIKYVHYRIDNIINILKIQGITFEEGVNLSSIGDLFTEEILEKLMGLEETVTKVIQENSLQHLLNYSWELSELFFKLDSNILLRKLPEDNLKALLKVLNCVKIVLEEVLEVKDLISDNDSIKK